MKKSIAVSVLMSVYNTEFFYIKRAIDSVLHQDFSSFELIIIDDGSSIDLSNPLLNYCKKHEDKITYIRHENCGQAASINKAVKISIGEYISIIDADDEYKPNHLSTCIKEMDTYDLIASQTETVVNEFDDYFVPDMNNNALNIHVDNCILFATLFGKRKVFESFSFENMYGADSHFYHQSSMQFNVKKLSSRTYIYYRNNINSITAKLKEVQIEQHVDR